MKRFLSVIMASVVLFFSQCKPEPVDENNGDNGKRVKVSCTIDINGGGKSDFTNLMDNGSVNWSNGLERVYVAIPGAEPRIIELISQSDGNHPKLEFEGEAAEGLITDGTEYDIWYFGHSKQLDIPYYSNDGSVLTGSIATQSGRLSDLGYNHIAKTTVTAETVEGNVVLNLNGTLRNQIAIALLDLENVTELYGDAIKGTEYSLQYNESAGKYELAVTEDGNARISVESAEGISYVVLFPNDTDESKIKCVRNAKTYAYSFYNGVKANKIYFKMNSDGVTPEALAWVEIEEEPETPDTPDYNGHEYVDLGLPSGLKWATCNVGATTPEEYGNYYAWGETTTKSDYSSSTSLTYEVSYSELQAQGIIDENGHLTPSYDAATANWGGNWRMPTKEECQELIDNCTWTWTTQNGVKGYKVTGPNGNHIFLPAAGYRDGSSLSSAGDGGIYWSSTPDESHSDGAYYLYFNSGFQDVGWYGRAEGQSVRPVSGENNSEPTVQLPTVTTNDVSNITTNSAICGGNVTSDGNTTVIARGICWSTNSNPTINDNKTSDGSGAGTFTSNLTNLTENTTYYVRAYATNEKGTSYGEQRSFTTLNYEYVDLGLPSGLKWATCNVGADSPEDYGNYYAWGETTTKSNYSSSNSATYGLSISQLQSQGYIDGSGNLTPSHDAARANWGGTWRLPTKAELEELENKCTWTWTTQNGVKGYKVTGPNGNHIFLPAAGYRDGSLLYEAGEFGTYWSSTPYESDSNFAYYLYFSSGFQGCVSWYYRFGGTSVRPVSE